MPWLLVLLCGCGLVHRARRFLTPPAYVAPPPAGELADVEYQHEGDPTSDYAPPPYKDSDLVRPMLIDVHGRIVIAPYEPGTTMRVYVRNTRYWRSDFREVLTVTGARDRELVEEIRFLPGPQPLLGPYTLHVADLRNPYNGYDLENDDLVLVELTSPAGVERYLFQNRQLGPYAEGAVTVLVRSPLSLSAADIALSPALTGSLVLGYRLRDPEEGITRALDQASLLLSLGIGTDELQRAADEEGVGQKLGDAAYSAVIGGGVRLFEVGSVQALVNVTALTADAPPQWTLGLGLDAARLAEFFRRAGARAFYPNTLSEPPPPQP